jgi:CDP-glucose 4,6-dehydratase
MIAGEKPLIRYPNAVRPWQHVLEALGGYIMIAERLFAGDQDVACGWNFGPRDEDAKPVDWIASRLTAAWGSPGWQGEDGPKPHEARYLKLDCTKARSELGWNPVQNFLTTEQNFRLFDLRNFEPIGQIVLNWC